jgi:hypothetical protein
VPGAFAVGDVLRTTDSVNMRTAASTSASIVTQLTFDSRLTVLGGPTSANGYTWWNVRHVTYGDGWVVSIYLQRVSGAPTSTPTTIAATATRTPTAPAGATSTPTRTPTRTATAANPGSLAIGDQAQVVTRVNFRSTASASGTLLTTLSVGTVVTITGGPTSADGYTWYQASVPGVGAGWFVGGAVVELPPGGSTLTPTRSPTPTATRTPTPVLTPSPTAAG